MVMHATPGAKQLASLQNMWQAAIPQLGSGFSNVPAGDYVADLKEMKLAQAKKGTGRWQVETSFLIVLGDQEGNTVKRFDGMEDSTQIGFFKGLAETIGLTIPDDITLLQEAMDSFVEQNAALGEYFDINVTVKPGENGKTYTNVYVNGVNQEFSAGVAEGEAEQVAEQIAEVTQEAEQVAPMRRFATPANNGGQIAKVAAKPIAAKPAPTLKPAAPMLRKASAVRR